MYKENDKRKPEPAAVCEDESARCVLDRKGLANQKIREILSPDGTASPNSTMTGFNRQETSAEGSPAPAQQTS